jgi:superkiller protein 3
MRQDHIDHPSQESACAGAVATPDKPHDQALELLKRHYQGQQHLRRGVCLLNAGQYDHAAREFSAADRANPNGRSLPRLLAACYVGTGQFDLAGETMEKLAQDEPTDVTPRVRRALLFWQEGRPTEAIEYLRNSLRDHPDSAELHFQLGTLLAATDDYQEAELRFTQAITIEKNHTDALIALAQCCAVDQRVTEAKRHLERAQRRRPHDARIGLLLAQAARSLADQGFTFTFQADMPGEHLTEDDGTIEQLSRIVEAEPELIDAILGLPSQKVDTDVYALLAETLNRALERRPQASALYRAQGQVLERLGRPNEAIAATERAVDLDPRSVRALIQLAKLYQQTDQDEDAVTRLEEVLRLGAQYADVYYLLGNLYRRQGQTERARWAYVSALKVNDRYEAARTALQTLAA